MHPLIANAKLLAYDLDGTLIDSVPDLASAVDQVLIDLEQEPAGIANVRQWVGNGSAALIKRALCNSLNGDQMLEDQDPKFERAHQLFLQHYDLCKGQQTRCYQGIFPLLESAQAAQLQQVLITNKPYRFVPEILSSLKLESFFAMVIGGDSLPEKKPSAYPLLHAARVLNIAPDEAVMIGDSITDIRAGQAAGFKTIAVRYGYDHGIPVDQCGADLVVDSLAELV